MKSKRIFFLWHFVIRLRFLKPILKCWKDVCYNKVRMASLKKHFLEFHRKNVVWKRKFFMNRQRVLIAVYCRCDKCFFFFAFAPLQVDSARRVHSLMSSAHLRGRHLLLLPSIRHGDGLGMVCGCGGDGVGMGWGWGGDGVGMGIKFFSWGYPHNPHRLGFQNSSLGQPPIFIQTIKMR